ncbi:MAG: choice-of-anchor J domain-containing protein [Muribaculaceae bacterium]|nr:choice-of-anchor J domain-containing protein [Muribaculaceae bacterium]
MKKSLLSMMLCGIAGMAMAAGTVENPLSVDDLLEAGTPDEPTEVVVKGYIVGVVEGASWTENASFTAPFTTASNLILAGSSTETDLDFCIPVQLPSGDIRTALSPAGHPENLGHQVILTGMNTKYFSVNGLKEVSAYEWVGEPPVAPEVPEELRGTVYNPLSVADYLKYGEDGTTVENCWVEGVIVGYVDGMTIDGAVFGATAPEGGEVSATNILIAASADVTDVAACIPVQLPAGDVRTALNLKDNPANLGKTVSMHGNREKYFGVTGLKSVDQYYWEGEKPKDPATDPNIAYYGLTVPGTGCDDWTLDNGTLPEGLTYVWYWAEKYGLCASAFKDVCFESDAWAVSPVIDLTEFKNVNLTFAQAANKFAASVADQVAVMVREGEGEWQKVDVELPAGDSWTFIDSEAALSDWDGKKIQIGFHYTSTAESAGTWEIQNLQVKGENVSGVEEVVFGESEVRVEGSSIVAPAGSRVFNLNGAAVGAENLAAGVYVVVTPSKAVKVMVR